MDPERRARSESAGLSFDFLSSVLFVLLLFPALLPSPLRFHLLTIAVCKSRASTIILSCTEGYPLIIMVSPSSSLLDFSDNDEDEHEYQNHPGDYSTRMGELFPDGSEADEQGSPSQSPRSGRVEVTKATYREQLRDVLGSEGTGEDDEIDDLDRPSPHGNAFSHEYPAQSASDPQRPVSPSVSSGVHGDILNTFSTADNPR